MGWLLFLTVIMQVVLSAIVMVTLIALGMATYGVISRTIRSIRSEREYNDEFYK